MADLTWYTADSAKSELVITVTAASLAVAQEQCLQVKGLPLDLAKPPSASFAQGVVYQALANRQAAQAVQSDELGNTNTIRLYPYDKKIMSMLIVPAPVYDADGETMIGDRSRVGSLIG